MIRKIYNRYCFKKDYQFWGALSIFKEILPPDLSGHQIKKFGAHFGSDCMLYIISHGVNQQQI